MQTSAEVAHDPALTTALERFEVLNQSLKELERDVMLFLQSVQGMHNQMANLSSRFAGLFSAVNHQQEIHLKDDSHGFHKCVSDISSNALHALETAILDTVLNPIQSQLTVNDGIYRRVKSRTRMVKEYVEFRQQLEARSACSQVHL